MKTGDEVKIRKDGEVFVLDRIKVCNSLATSAYLALSLYVAGNHEGTYCVS